MAITSRFTAKPIPAIGLAQYFRESVQPFLDAVALVDGPTGRSYTFRNVLDHASSIAHALIARGVKQGDRVAFVVPNIAEVALAYHGTIAAGAIAMMVNPLSTPDELKKYFAVGQPKLVITVPPLVDGIVKAMPDLPIVVLGEDSFRELLGGPTTPPALSVDLDDVAVMPYSSGTTGFPKGVMLSHRNILTQIHAIEAVADSAVVLPNQAIVAVLPFFHIYGIMAFLTYGMSRGAKLVTMPRFDLEQYVQLVNQHEAPILHVVPPILLGLAKYPGTLSLPKVEAALSGAAPLSKELAAEFTARTGVKVYQVYGMTEVTGASHLGARTGDKPGAIGKLIGNCELRLVSPETGEDAEQGEIWVRADYVMKGYFENPEATAATIDQDGWLHTGDIAYMDADGDFWIVDRVKELIKYKGLQVAPAELEAVLLQHPAVADVAVYGQPDAEAGELPKAAVVLKPGASATPEELIQFCATRVSPQKRVRVVKLVTAIPKSASGKILRRVLKEQD